MTARVETTTPPPRAQASVRAGDAQAQLERYRAPFSLRCGALLIDYIILAIIIAFCTLLARPLGSGTRAAGSGVEAFGIFAALAALLLNLSVVVVWRGQTLGKWATGLRIEPKDGGPLEWWRILVRHFLGYPLSLLTLGIGFLVAVFDAQGRALHDLIAGTIVVRDVGQRRRQSSRGTRVR